MLLPQYLPAQDNCSIAFSGKVIDANTKEALPFATVYIQELQTGVVADEKGQFRKDKLCPGSYTFVCSFIGYASTTYKTGISKNTSFIFSLQPETTIIDEVVVKGEREEDRALVSQSKIEIKSEDLIKVRGATLGEALTSITGVYTLQSGPSIFKPVIHGLHSNRVLLFNNGVRQEGQQWGSEHAPEIDPFIGTKLTVVKGASGVRYGSDAIGGVILVEPAELPRNQAISGEVNLVGATNNRMGVVSGILQGGFGKKLPALSWRAQGTYRRAGNSMAPNYYMENTGFAEANFSGALSFRKPKYGGEIYYSQFNTRLGIFSGSHAESVSDMEAAIHRPEPITPSYFSYDIGRPYQQVKHDLFKANAYVNFKNTSRLDVIYARQQNERSEYDYVPLNGNLNPELFLRLITHTVDAVYKQKEHGHFTAVMGFNGMTQGNVREYEMLIPNFRNYSGGLFYIGKWTLDRFTLEAGARYDYKWLRAYTLDNSTAQVITPTWTFNNVSGTVGSLYNISRFLSWNINLGTAWRAPSINELMSNGVHQSAVAYEIGNPNLTSERALNLNTSLHFHKDRLHGEIGVYGNFIAGYIFLKPDHQYIHTVRGAYPTYTYTQVDATFKGLDLTASYRLVDSLSITTKVSLIYAWNRTINDYLQLIPANRFENTLRYGLGNKGIFRQLSISVTDTYVAHQSHVPANSDYLPPPPAYMLLGANISFSIHAGHQLVNVSVTASNMLNFAYRDYMDRFRYFTDEPGRNFMLRVRIPFGSTQQNN